MPLNCFSQRCWRLQLSNQPEHLPSNSNSFTLSLFDVEPVELWATPLVLSTFAQASGRPIRPLFTHESRRGTERKDTVSLAGDELKLATTATTGARTEAVYRRSR